MNVLVLICIIALGLNVLRFVLGAVKIIFTGEVTPTVKVGWFMRTFNLVETIAIVSAYVLMVVAYYK